VRVRGNPSVPRIRHIAGQYPPFVTMLTIKGWLEAIGAHEFWELLASTFDQYGQHNPVAGLVDIVESLEPNMGGWGVSANSEFDRYLPWLARELNRVYKPYRKMAKRTGLPVYPPRYSMARTTIDWGRDPWPDMPEDQVDVASAFNDQSESIVNSFASIVQWAKSTRADLNQLTAQQAREEAAQWLESKRDPAVRGDVVYDFGDGWTVQELGAYCDPDGDVKQAKAELEFEGNAMGHCVGSYRVWCEYATLRETMIVDPYSDRRVKIYSLRDPKGYPHATLELHHAGFVSQLRGKQNEAPKSEYLHRMVQFRRDYMDREFPRRGYVRRLPDQPRLDVFKPRMLGVFEIRDLGGQPMALFPGVDQGVEVSELQDWLEENSHKLDESNHITRYTPRTWGAEPEGGLSAFSLIESEPGLDWEIWKLSGGTANLRRDEMVAHLINAAIPHDSYKPRSGRKKSSAANPSRMAALKRKLMR